MLAANSSFQAVALMDFAQRFPRSIIGNASFAATVERGQMRIVATRENRIAHHRAFQDLGSAKKPVQRRPGNSQRSR